MMFQFEVTVRAGDLKLLTGIALIVLITHSLWIYILRRLVDIGEDIYNYMTSGIGSPP